MFVTDATITASRVSGDEGWYQPQLRSMSLAELYGCFLARDPTGKHFLIDFEAICKNPMNSKIIARQITELFRRLEIPSAIKTEMQRICAENRISLE